MIFVDHFRRNLILTLWSGGNLLLNKSHKNNHIGCVGAATGYCVSVLKGAPIQLYMTSMTMTFGVSSMVFYGSYHYLKQGMGDNLWSWMISGATTGIVGGICSNPRYIPLTTLCFTGLGMIGYACHRGFDRYYKVKQLKIKQERGLITEEEKEKLSGLSIGIKKPDFSRFIGKIEK